MTDDERDYLESLIFDDFRCKNRYCSICAEVKFLSDSARWLLKEAEKSEMEIRRMLMEFEHIGE
jgi:hypothetical protein